MGTLTKKLHILKTGGTEETCNIYTTAEEVGGSPYLALEVDGAKGYVKLGSTTDANATHLRVEKDGVIYAAWKEAVTYVNVTITQSANQTIHVYTPKKSGGTDHTSSFTIPKGTTYEAEVIPADGYTAGTLNVNAGGRINSDMTFSASGATSSVPTGSQKITVNNGNFAFITIPNNVRVVRVGGYYIGVTPNKEYKLTGGIPYIHHKGDNRDPFLKDVRSGVYWYGTSPLNYRGTISADFTICWSPAISAHSLDVTDY